MTITDLFVESFPPTDGSGGGWDLTNGPELYIQVYKGSNQLYSSPTYYSNASNGNNYEFTPNSPINILYPDQTYIIKFWDYDTPDPDDYMGALNITPYWSSTNGFPSTIEFSAGQYKIKATVTYAW